jgi:CheY-like chemotaxis protein
MGWVSLLRQARLEPARVASVLEIVERNARAQAQIIADVLDISRMITGRIRLTPVPVSVAQVVLDALDTIRPGAEAKGIEIHTDVDEGPVVHADPERLQQVFWNVFSNACKFTPPGGRIAVGLHNGGEWCTVTVSDTGVGISPDFLPYVFDRFRQADQSFTRAHGGLGLGLAIVKHIVEMHGGQVSVASDGVNTGARFEIRLPAASDVRPASTPSDGIEPDTIPDVDFEGRLLLVVDDDEATRDVVRAMLTGCGARAIAVDSVRAALEQFERERPAAIVADIGMPGEDGLSMMRRIRSRSAAAGGAVPAVALSAYARGDDRDAALAAGFNAFLTKPAMPADIIRTVARVLDRPKPAPGRRARPKAGRASST